MKKIFPDEKPFVAEDGSITVSILQDLGSSDGRTYLFDKNSKVKTRAKTILEASPIVMKNQFHRICDVSATSAASADSESTGGIGLVNSLTSNFDYKNFLNHLKDHPLFAESNTVIFKYKDGIFAHGDFVDAEYSHGSTKALQGGSKIYFESTYLSIQNILSRYVCEHFLQDSDATLPSHIYIDGNFALPPTILDASSDIFEARLRENITEVQVCWPLSSGKNVSIPVTFLDKINFFPEGSLAVSPILLKAILSDDGSYVTFAVNKATADLYTYGMWILCDLGSTTLDLVLVNANAVPVMRTRKTIDQGFQKIISYYADNITVTCNRKMVCTFEGAANAVTTCSVYLPGEGLKGTSRCLNAAKKKFSTDVEGALNDWISSFGSPVPTQLIGVVFIGGGSLPSVKVKGGVETVVSEPASTYLLESLRKVAPNIQEYKYNNDPRLVNLEGIRYNYLFREKLVKTV